MKILYLVFVGDLVWILKLLFSKHFWSNKGLTVPKLWKSTVAAYQILDSQIFCAIMLEHVILSHRSSMAFSH